MCGHSCKKQGLIQNNNVESLKQSDYDEIASDDPELLKLLQDITGATDILPSG